MRHLQHLYSAWYNRSRPIRRRGPLWAGRFKNTVLEDGAALWACWTYIERNPVRAGMVEDAADYRFCSYGRWRQSGRHPFAAALEAHLIPSLPARPQKTLEPTSQTAVHLPGIRPTRPLSLGIRYAQTSRRRPPEQSRGLCRNFSVPSAKQNAALLHSSEPACRSAYRRACLTLGSVAKAMMKTGSTATAAGVAKD